MSSKPTSDSEAVILQPRRRGRPPKNPSVALPKSPITLQQIHLSKVQKRPRGRPRKITVLSPTPGSTQSPQRPSRRVRKKRGRPQKKHDEDQLYDLRDILDESETHYLIDWEDDKVTGETYEPTWEPKSFVEQDAIVIWEAKKAQVEVEKNQVQQPQSQDAAEVLNPVPPENQQGEPPPVPDSTQESEPIRDAKRKRVITVIDSLASVQESPDSQPIKPAKRGRITTVAWEAHEANNYRRSSSDSVAPEGNVDITGQGSTPTKRVSDEGPHTIPESQPQTHSHEVGDTSRSSQLIWDQSATPNEQVLSAEDIQTIDFAIPRSSQNSNNVAHSPTKSPLTARPSSHPTPQPISDHPPEIDDSFGTVAETPQARLAPLGEFDRDKYISISQISSFVSEAPHTQRSLHRSQSAGDQLHRVLEDRVIPDSQEATAANSADFRRSARSRTYPGTPEKRPPTAHSPSHPDITRTSPNADNLIRLVDDISTVGQDSCTVHGINSEAQRSISTHRETISHLNAPTPNKVPVEDSWLTTKIVPSPVLKSQSQHSTFHETPGSNGGFLADAETTVAGPSPSQYSQPSTPKPNLSRLFLPQVSSSSRTSEERFQTQLPFSTDTSNIDSQHLNFYNRSSGVYQGHSVLPISTDCSENEFDRPVTVSPLERDVASSNQSWQAAQVVQDTGLPSQISLEYTKVSELAEAEFRHISRDCAKFRHISRDCAKEISPAPDNPHSQSPPPSRSKEDGSRTRIESEEPPENTIMSVERQDESELVQQPSLPSTSASPAPVSRGGSAAQDRPPAVFNSNMNVTEFLQKARRDAIAAARARASPANSRVGSEPIQTNEPSQPPSIVRQELPVRETALALDEGSMAAPDLARIESPDEEDVSSPQLPLRPFGSNDHIVLIPMVSTVRDMYNDQVPKYRREIELLRKGEQLDLQATARIDLMIENLKLLGDHKDLFSEEGFSQNGTPAETISKWAMTCSPKCYFLERLFESMRDSTSHVAVLARPGLMMDILEAILQVHNFNYYRPDRQSRSELSARGTLTVTLLPTGFKGGQFVVNPADAVIAFDSTFFNGERYSKTLRSHTFDPTRQSPLIMLVVEDSAEHFELCLPQSLDPIEKKCYLVDFICQQRKEVGLNTKIRPEDAAVSIGNYLRANSSNHTGVDGRLEWPLPPNRFVSNLDVPDSLLPQQSGSTTQSRDVETPGPASLQNLSKRPRDDLVDDDLTKRMRMTPVPPEIASSGQVSHITDSLGFQTQFNASSLPSLTNSAEQAIAATATLDQAQSDQMTQLLARIADLEIQLETKTATESQIHELEAKLQESERDNARLRQSNTTLELKLNEHISLVNKFVSQSRESANQRRIAETTATAAESRATSLHTRLEARSTQNISLLAKVGDLEAELTTARAALASSAIPEQREFEALREKAAEAQAEREKLEKRAVSSAKDFEFTREQYQRASNQAAELASEVAGLQAEKVALERKASENFVRVREIQARSEVAQLKDRIDELEAEAELLKADLDRKNEEIKARGARGLRGASIPRSPKVTGMGIAGSRGSSVAPGEGNGFPPRWVGMSG